jgi:hypothetical protein
MSILKQVGHNRFSKYRVGEITTTEVQFK